MVNFWGSLQKVFTIFDKIKSKLLAFWEKYIAAYGQSVKDGYKSNAFAPIAWFVIFLIIPLVIIILFVKNDIIKYISIGFLIFIVVFALIMYVKIFKKDPKLLQSEWYRLEDKRMDMISQQGGTPTLPDLNNNTEVKGELGE